MKITMVGTGYVGLVTGTCFAEFGHHVTCVDKLSDKIEKLTEGVIPIYEPGLDALVSKNLNDGHLRFTTNLAEAVASAEAVFLAVGTPSSRRGDGYADLTYIYEATKEVARHLTGYTIIVDKSTVPVGTAVKVRGWIQEELEKLERDTVPLERIVAPFPRISYDEAFTVLKRPKRENLFDISLPTKCTHRPTYRSKVLYRIII